MRPPTEKRIEALRQCADEGLTRGETAERLGLTYQTVVRHGLAHSIKFTRKKNIGHDPRRASTILKLYQAGYTLQNIGDRYGLTRERIRQILAKHGVRGPDGGQCVRAKRRAVAEQAKRDAECLKIHGCTYEQHRDLRTHCRELGKQGITRDRQPIGAFIRQKWNAHVRGIPWQLTLWQWWALWQESGKWDERGRGHGYAMCRYGDVGPYSADNVFITTNAANIQDYWLRRRGEKRAKLSGVAA